VCDCFDVGCLGEEVEDGNGFGFVIDQLGEFFCHLRGVAGDVDDCFWFEGVDCRDDFFVQACAGWVDDERCIFSNVGGKDFCVCASGACVYEFVRFDIFLCTIYI